MSAESLGATTEIETPEPDGEEQVETPGAESPPAASDAGEQGKPKDGPSQRIDELTRNWRETERDRDYWRDEALRGRRQETPPREERTEPPGEPAFKTLADFGYDEKAYNAYLVKELDDRSERRVQKLRTELHDTRTAEDREITRSDFEDRAQKWAKEQKIEDFDLAFRAPKDGGPQITEAMAEVIMDGESGPALLHYLAKNRTVAAQIARMPPLQQAREIGRLEAKVAKVATTKVSTAPPPAPRVEGAATTVSRVSTTSPDSDKLSDDEWVKAERARVARKAKRAGT